jgi:Tfp pilus assembly protein PilE
MKTIKIKLIYLGVLAFGLSGVILAYSQNPSSLEEKYDESIEKVIVSEAETILGQIRTLEEAYKFEKKEYADLKELCEFFKYDIPQVCEPGYYYRYTVEIGQRGEFKAFAMRCARGGREPQGKESYTISIDKEGNLTSSKPEYIKETKQNL